MINPVEIDTQLAELYLAGQKASQALKAAQEHGHQVVGDRRTSHGRVWKFNENEVFEKLEAMTQLPTYEARSAERVLEKLDKVVEAIEAARTAMAPLNELFDTHNWTRAFLVAGGHVHSSRSCRSCYPTTQYCWLPMLSGHDEAEIIELAGDRACTVCYPSAPVETLSRPTQLFTPDERAAQADREAKLAAKAARDAKKAADAITNPDGSPLMIQGTFRRETVKNLRAARMELTDEYSYALWLNRPINQENVRVLTEAIAAKEAKTVDQVIAEAQKRAEKRK